MSTVQIAALVTALLGCVTDIATRKIPNVLTLGTAVCACAFHASAFGVAGAGFAAAGWALGLLLFLPFFLLRGMGGGDVKLLAGLGAWIGPQQVVWLALFAAVAGGPLAVLLALSRGYGRQLFGNVASLLTFWRVAGIRPHPTLTLESGRGPRLPYAIPIAAGLVATIWLK